MSIDSTPDPMPLLPMMFGTLIMGSLSPLPSKLRLRSPKISQIRFLIMGPRCVPNHSQSPFSFKIEIERFRCMEIEGMSIARIRSTVELEKCKYFPVFGFRTLGTLGIHFGALTETERSQIKHQSNTKRTLIEHRTPIEH